MVFSKPMPRPESATDSEMDTPTPENGDEGLMERLSPAAQRHASSAGGSEVGVRSSNTLVPWFSSVTQEHFCRTLYAFA